MAFLHEIFNNPFARKALAEVKLPSHIGDNLKYDIRLYQEEAFKRYLYLEQENFEGKPNKPMHLLYNMATGSGKTLVMAGLILHLYEKGHRNFLFFVNSNNIIQKTKDNFLNAQSSKYLFKDKI
ncbi:MAG: DEAD/DEAH box helicase family protein, partial [Brumimicrobium sp.]